jgi:small-conductance mechanosensitive channel
MMTAMMACLRRLLLAIVLALAPAVVLVGVSAPVAHAQQPPSGPNYDRWQDVAGRADEAISAGRASTNAMEELRNQLVDWRDVFFSAQSINANAIETVESQVKALGPVPENGTSESDGIAEQRAALTAQLNRLREPVKRAQLAYSQADGLIRGIDTIIRERQAEELTELGPSPVNPKNWSEGIDALRQTGETVRTEIRLAWANPIQKDETKQALPKVLLLFVLGVVLMARGRFWVDLFIRIGLPQQATSASWIITLVVSLGEMVVPFVGFLLISEALYGSGLIGLRGDLILSSMKPSIFIFVVARWLSLRCFPRLETYRLPLALDAPDRKAGRLYGGLLGFVIALFYFESDLAQATGWSDAAFNVNLFPIILVAALLLLRLSRLLTHHSRNAGSDEQTDSYRNRLTRFLANALVALAIVSPVLAAIGYFKAAVALMLPSLLSLMVLAALLVIQRIISEVYTLISRDREGAADELVPVLLGFVIVLLSLPFFALIWGARTADLLEIWTRFTKGVTLGETTISPTIFLTLAMVFAAGYILTRLLQGTLKNTVLPKTRMDAGGRNAVVSGVGYIGIFLAALIAVTSAGLDLSSVAIVAGALSVGIGFGLQTVVSNFVSGIILLIERPISQGDWIEVNGQHGTVREISVRSTRIETFDRSDLIIPNADLISGTVTNYTRGNTVGRCIVRVGVAYGSDTEKVAAILLEIASANPMVLINPPPTVIFKNFGADSLEFEVRMILRDINWVMNVTSEVNHAIAKRFVSEGLEIPFAQRDLWIRNPEALRPLAPTATPEAKPQDQDDTAPLQMAGPPNTRPQRMEADDADGDGDGGDK